MYYIVQPGDSLHSVAMQYNTTVRHLMDLNPRISNSNRIHVGERIEVGNQWSLMVGKRMAEGPGRISKGPRRVSKGP